jgi:hypothetical protein
MPFLPSPGPRAGLLDACRSFPETSKPLIEYHEVLLTRRVAFQGGAVRVDRRLCVWLEPVMTGSESWSRAGKVAGRRVPSWLRPWPRTGPGGLSALPISAARNSISGRRQVRR